jgi:transcription elongation factor GreA
MQNSTVVYSEATMDASAPVYITREGVNKLRQERDRLFNVERPALIARVRDAAEDGDLLENDEYQLALADEAFLEGRIRDLDALLRNPEIFEVGQGSTEEVGLGSSVMVIAEDQDEPETFVIVGRVECDPDTGRISNESPIGSALMARKVGESVTVRTPETSVVLKIIAIG